MNKNKLTRRGTKVVDIKIQIEASVQHFIFKTNLPCNGDKGSKQSPSKIQYLLLIVEALQTSRQRQTRSRIFSLLNYDFYVRKQ